MNAELNKGPEFIEIDAAFLMKVAAELSKKLEDSKPCHYISGMKREVCYDEKPLL